MPRLTSSPKRYEPPRGLYEAASFCPNMLMCGFLFKVFSEANSILVSRGSSLTSDPERTLIVGYSLGGLMACYAAWTRPNAISFLFFIDAFPE